MIRENREHADPLQHDHASCHRGSEESNGIPLDRTKRLAHVFRILSNRYAAKIIQTLCHREMSLWAIASELDMKPVVVLRQILSLRRAALLSSRKRGNAVLHSLANPELAEALGLLHTMCARELQRSSSSPVPQKTIHSLPPRPARRPGAVSDGGAAVLRKRGRA